MASLPSIPKLSLSRNQIIIIAGAVFLIAVILVLVFFYGSKKPSGAPVTLTVWGTDSPDAFKDAIAGYQTLRPNATVNYVQVASAGYDAALIKALASGKGPDLFFIGNHDILSRSDLLAAAPAAQVTLANMQALFPQAVLQDFAYDGRMYALPLYMDTLVLLYNKQMFDQAGIATPPTTWQEILGIVPRLRVMDENGRITRSALAIGGSERSVVHGTDILNLIMLQNGTSMASDLGKPSFSRGPSGVAAFRFYLQFADTASPNYNWNDSLGDSLESFISQKTAMAFAYRSDLPFIKKQAPFLDFAATPVPQVDVNQAVNYPSYRGVAVWTGSKVQAWAWDFALFASTNYAAQASYLAFTDHPAALRSVIAKQQEDLDMGIFADASLTARSWKMGDYDKIRTIFNTAILNVQTGAKTADAALADAEAQAGQLVPN